MTYQDYVIRDGQFVGRFEEMYAACDDPWHQSAEDLDQTSRMTGVFVCQRLRQRLGCRTAVEIGCGFGRYTERLAWTGLDMVGLDISPTAIAKARHLFPQLRFEVGEIDDYRTIRNISPDVIVMSHVTWYVLPKLRGFLDFLRRELPSTLLYHIVSTFAPEEQKYGKDYFTTPDEIRAWFDMNYYEWGEIHAVHGTDAYFLGAWSDERLKQWQPF